MNTAA